MGLTSDQIEDARRTPIQSVIEARGIKLVGRADRCGPCPICGGRDRFSINVRKQVFLCRGCGAGGDVIALTMFLDGCDFREAIEALTGKRTSEKRPCAPSKPPPAKIIATDDAERRDKARWLWRQRQPIVGSIAETYLRIARGYRGVFRRRSDFFPPAEIIRPP